MTRQKSGSLLTLANVLAGVLGLGLLSVLAFGLVQFVAGQRKAERLERVGGSHTSYSSAGTGTLTIEGGNRIDFEEPISDEQLGQLEQEIKSYRKLSLDLSESNITDAGLRYLENAINIIELELDGTQITDTGLALLTTLDNLAELSLSHCNITDAGLKQLKSLPKLRYLHLSHTQITDEGLVHLHALEYLNHVTIGWGDVTPAGADALRRAMPGTTVRRIGPPFDDPIKDVRVTDEQGTPTPTDGGPVADVCRKYFQALQERDFFTVKSLWSSDSSVSWGETSDEFLSFLGNQCNIGLRTSLLYLAG